MSEQATILGPQASGDYFPGGYRLAPFDGFSYPRQDVLPWDRSNVEGGGMLAGLHSQAYFTPGFGDVPRAGVDFERVRVSPGDSSPRYGVDALSPAVEDDGHDDVLAEPTGGDEPADQTGAPGGRGNRLGGFGLPNLWIVLLVLLLLLGHELSNLT